MPKFFNPDSIARPDGGRYRHGVEVAAGSRLLYIAGQTGVAPDGSIPESIEEQAENTYRNVEAILREAGMTFGNVIKMNAFLIDRAYLPALREARMSIMGGHLPTHTMLLVSGLANPKFKCEVEAVAAEN